jgi:hypothetical protein
MLKANYGSIVAYYTGIVPCYGETATPDVYDIAECIRQAYFDPARVNKYGEESRKFTLPFDWDKIVKDHWVPLLDKMADKIKAENRN